MVALALAKDVLGDTFQEKCHLPEEVRALRGLRKRIEHREGLGAHSAVAALGPSVCVQLHSFTSNPELNGAEGVCQRWDLERNMWLVRLERGGEVHVEPWRLQSMEKLALRPLVPVKIAGFQLLPELNGMSGCCKKWLSKIGCWQVRLSATMESVLVEPQNLEVIVPDPDCLFLGFCHPDFYPDFQRAWTSCTPEFDAEIKELAEVANTDVKGFLPRLKQLRARQKVTDMLISLCNPVFRRFGIPEGQRGYDLVGIESNRLARLYPQFQESFAESKRQSGIAHMSTPEIHAEQLRKEARYRARLERFKQAPRALLTPLCMALAIPVDATPDQIAAQLPLLKEYAKSLAERLEQSGQIEFFSSTIAVGSDALRMDMSRCSEYEFRSALQESAEAYLRTLFDKVLDIHEFTSAHDWHCSWADKLIQWWHATALLRKPVDGTCTKAGYTIIDHSIEEKLAEAVRSELCELAEWEKLTMSNNLCNRGANYIWLHFKSEEERLEMPPALREVCLKLAGLPRAIEDAARRFGTSSSSSVPKLCILPEVMAASYDIGAEYHVHRDSDGTNNSRIFTILLYLNAGWMPGDGGELRIHASTSKEEGKPQPVMDEFVDIAPICGRLVIFHSRDIWHAVREPRNQRWALTLWVMSEPQ